MSDKNFKNRHIGTLNQDHKSMLDLIGVASNEELISQTIPASIRLDKDLNLPPAINEYQFSKHIDKLAKKNKIYKSYIGFGYYDTITPSVIKRNILENPGWYTAYTPYQAEIAQGRLEALLNFQTMISDLTGMELANASLLDEATAAAEAMIMLYNSRSREQQKNNLSQFIVSDKCLPHTIDVLKTRSEPLDITLIITNIDVYEPTGKEFGMIIQYPEKDGKVMTDISVLDKYKALQIKIAVAADLMSLALLTPPGEWGADVVIGNTQRFGVPLGFGGPHAAYFATKDEYKRSVPGRVIGVSIDSNGNKALRMALQTREQHIKRDKATSNICTAQALLSIMASMYAVYHGPKGISSIAENINLKTVVLARKLKDLGYGIEHNNFFDTISVLLPVNINQEQLQNIAISNEINFNYFEKGKVIISLDETTDVEDINLIIGVFAKAADKDFEYLGESAISSVESVIPISVQRTSSFLTHPVFNSYHSETEMMRYIKRLENKDLSLVHSMISLGSCTMKLNAASELYPLSNPHFSKIHPFVPENQAQGYYEMLSELDALLSEITGFAAMSFQPNSGAQGEYAGLMVIRAYHISRGDNHRNIALIPSSAHGTNPASAVMAGMKVVVVKCDEEGNIDINDLREKTLANKDNLSCLMVTYPSTHGVFEENIREVIALIHENGGQVYMDGANMNAQVGLTSPGFIGADVCHLNLHKTFAIPHGGGGPGMGPIGVAKHLVPFLPGHCLIPSGPQAINAVSAAPFGSASILTISYGYIKMLGKDGVKLSTEMAILNANYMKKRLEGKFDVLYSGKSGKVAHEMIIDCRDFKKEAGIEVEDIAKRLIDYGFHAPTVSFPVAGTIMIEPTESESKAELDKFCDALLSIRQEIEEVKLGIADMQQNVLKNAPHTAGVITADEWDRPYSRQKAAYPLPYIKVSKFWPSVGRVDNAYGDRNLVCTCPSIESYEETLV
jgi:glycine dehydrogenase